MPAHPVPGTYPVTLVVEDVYFPGSWPGPDGLRKTLLDSASFHARAAIADYTRSDERYVDAAFHCGTAIEHLTKSFLASLHPALIVDKGDFDSLLILTGHAEHAKKSRGTDLRTVGLTEACQRVRQVLPTFRPEPRLSVLSNVRNAAAHLAITSRNDICQAVQGMVVLATPLLEALDASPEAFWREFADVASVLRDDALAEVDRVVASKLESARQTLRQRLEGLHTSARKAVLSAIAGKTHWTQDYEHPQTCPVCKQAACLICQLWTEETDTQPHPADGSPMPHAYALIDGFYCSACELELDNADETRALDMPEEVDLGYLPLDEYGLPVVPPGSGAV